VYIGEAGCYFRERKKMWAICPRAALLLDLDDCPAGQSQMDKRENERIVAFYSLAF